MKAEERMQRIENILKETTTWDNYYRCAEERKKQDEVRWINNRAYTNSLCDLTNFRCKIRQEAWLPKKMAVLKALYQSFVEANAKGGK